MTLLVNTLTANQLLKTLFWNGKKKELFKFPACAALRPSVDKSFVVEEMVSIPARTEQGKD